MSEIMSKDRSERMAKDMSERYVRRYVIRKSVKRFVRKNGKRYVRKMSERMSEDMSERMSEDMSGRTSEILSQVYVHTQIWITRIHVCTNGILWMASCFSRKRPRRVLSKKALPLKTVIKDCPKFCWSDGCLYRLSSKTAQSSAEVMAVFKDCHQRLPKVLLKWWLSSKIVIKDCLKFRWSDGCPARLSSKTAQSSAEVMAVLKDCHQRLPKVLLKWWLSLKIVITDCLKFCWSDGCLQRLEKRLQIFKD